MRDDLRPIDWGPLDPARDAERWERRIADAVRRAAPELARRAAPPGPLLVLGGWLRPAFAAAAALAALSAGALVWSERSAPVATTEPIESVLLAEPVSGWVAEGRAPTSSDLLAVVEDLP